MGEIERAMAKLAAVHKAVTSLMHENIAQRGPPVVRKQFLPSVVKEYFSQADDNLDILRRHAPDWYADFRDLSMRPDVDIGEGKLLFSRARMAQLVRDIDQMIEIRANSEHAKPMTPEPLKRVFISHGRAKDWLEVQVHVEKDLALQTMELAQEASQGRTIFEKLEAGSASCDSAVIVMSGDDLDAEGQAKVRENVMHEIGFFQGRYGRNRVVLLHEDGVSVPTNLAGIVYVAYPKGKVDGAFGVLDRERACPEFCVRGITSL